MEVLYGQAKRESRAGKIKEEIESWRILGMSQESYLRGFSDEDIYVVFREANSLHSNFYEVSLKEEDVMISFERIRMLVGKLLEIVRNELKIVEEPRES